MFLIPPFSVSSGGFLDPVINKLAEPQNLAVLALVLVFATVNVLFTTKRGRRWKSRAHNGPIGARQGNIVPFGEPASSLSDPRSQMEFIANAAFEKQRLLNKEEARLLPLIERTVSSLGQGHRVMAQTSLGELIRPRKGSADAKTLKNAYSSINSKRVDFAVIDRAGYLVCAIEYQGSGHYQSGAFMRDAVKREALRKSGVNFLEIGTGYTPEKVEEGVLRALRSSEGSASLYDKV